MQKRTIYRLVGLLLGMGLLALTHDIIITNILAFRICQAEPNPKTLIKRTVESPESIYWEDNIYPGFDEKDRLLMIRNYLDGVHLKTMALNGPDGRIHVYTATAVDWQVRRGEPNYFDRLNAEAKAIAERGKTATPETMPKMNFRVVLNPVSLTSFQRRYLWSDEVRITDNATSEVIAYNRRLMRRWYMVAPDFALGNRYYSPEAMCGWGGYDGFDDKAFPIKRINGMNHLQFVNNRIFHLMKGG